MATETRVSAEARLLARFLDDMPAGRVEWIGVRPGHRQAMLVKHEVKALASHGLQGDRRCQSSPGSPRQVTFISREHIDVIKRLLGLEQLPPELLRRNVMTSGINLSALRYQRFRVGEHAEFEATVACHPCRRMEQVLGKSGIAAMMGHGGLCAKILTPGVFRIGDPVVHLGPALATQP